MADDHKEEEGCPVSRVAYNITDPAEFVSRVASGDIKLPYKRSYTTFAEIMTRFDNLRKMAADGADPMTADLIKHSSYRLNGADFGPRELVFTDDAGHRPACTLFVYPKGHYQLYGAISDYWQEPQRLRAVRCETNLSAEEFFYSRASVIADDCIRTYGAITPYNAREALFWQSYECSAFTPVGMMYFVMRFEAQSVLDPCAGWGDRLIAALATRIRYVGVDPNADLHPGYEEIVRAFAPADEPDYRAPTLICAPIQTADLGGEMFDLVFTSPPYFDIEKYQGGGAMPDGMTETEWLESFLWPMLDISLAHLRIGGHVCINLAQHTHHTYLRRMLAYMETKPNVRYLGVISYADHRLRNPQPVWIWRLEQTPVARPADDGWSLASRPAGRRPTPRPRQS
jgi:hypothetical protein